MIYKKTFFIFVFMFLFLASGVVYSETNENILSTGEISVFAVSPSKIAMTAILHVEILDGDGKIYSSINNNVGQSTIESERNAVSVAEMFFPEIKDKHNYLFHIESPATSIDGPSAGAAMAFLLINMFENIQIDNVSITGTITSDGYVGNVSGIYEKAQEASKNGVKLFMIPKGNRNQVVENGDESKLVDIVDYAYKEWGLKIVEVSTIDDILKYGRMPIDEIDIYATEQTIVNDFIPETTEYPLVLEPMKDVANNYYEIAVDELTNVEQKLDSVPINDPSILQTLLFLVERARNYVDDANTYLAGNYLYTSANGSFLSLIYARTANEIIDNPSIISESSIVFDIKIDDLDKEIKQTITRSSKCSVNKLEWCVGAKQRIIWAENQLSTVVDDSSDDVISRLINYSYAVAWNEIANTFLDVAITDSQEYFIEADSFEILAKKYIVDIENKLAVSSVSVANNQDLQRRLSAAKSGLKKGWYVTSLYDSATVLAIIDSDQEETLDEDDVIKEFNKYNNLFNKEPNFSSSENVWSKMFINHAGYYYELYNHYKDLGTSQQQNHLKTMNNIVLYSKYFYDVEQEILSFYENTTIDDVILPVNIDDQDIEQIYPGSRPIYIYQSPSDDSKKREFTAYVLFGALFLCIFAIIWDLENLKSKKTKLLLKILDLDEDYNNKKISKKTYDEMRNKLMTDLKDLHNRRKNMKKDGLFYLDKQEPIINKKPNVSKKRASTRKKLPTSKKKTTSKK